MLRKVRKIVGSVNCVLYVYKVVLCPLLITSFGKEITKYEIYKKNNNSDAFFMTGRSRVDCKLIQFNDKNTFIILIKVGLQSAGTILNKSLIMCVICLA